MSVKNINFRLNKGGLMSQRALKDARWQASVAQGVIKREKLAGYLTFCRCGCGNRHCGCFAFIKENIPAPVVEPKIKKERVCEHFSGKAS